MAGRGISLIVQLLDGESGGVEEMSLPVALHAPLEVLRSQLHEATGIPSAQQVLILCDLKDSERNNDKLLVGMDFLSLRDCGITCGSTLTLHSLGLTPELRKSLVANAQALSKTAAISDAASENIYTLSTAISAAQANHSYAGVIFDISVKGPHLVDVQSFSFGGMLGRVRIFARNCSWESGSDPHSPRQALGWALVADTVCRPCWDRSFTVALMKPFRMLPHSTHGFYIHSSLPGDLGIQYQSYSKNEIVAQDGHLVLSPGIGHAVRHDVASCEPFDHHDSWYRSYR